MVVEVRENSNILGYIKETNYDKAKYSITHNMQDAKNYEDEDEAISDIDFFTNSSNIVFSYIKGVYYGN